VMWRIPKQIYILIAAVIVLGSLLYQLDHQVDRQSSPIEDSLLEAELIMGIPTIPNLGGWPPSLLVALREIHRGFGDQETQAKSLKDLGRLYFINGFMGQARQCFDALRKIEPSEARWAYFLGMVTRDYQNKELAIEAFRESLLIGQAYPNARYHLGQSYLGSGRILESVDAFGPLLGKNEWAGWAHFGLAKGLALEERYVEALAELDLAIEEMGDVREFYAFLVEVAPYAGRRSGVENARKELERIEYDRDPYDPWFQDLWSLCFDPFRLMLLAKAEELEGDLSKASEILERAVEIDGEDPEILEALEALLRRL
jgi:tetratricopeptide (TPR) repeat protein